MAFRYLTPYRATGMRPAGGAQGGSIFDLHRQMNKLFDDIFDQQGGEQGSTIGGGSHPVMDVHQENGRVEITAELPGVREEDIDLSVEDGVLILSGEKRSSRENGPNGYRERSYGRFERRITLPQNIDEDRIEANFEHGVLTITLPIAAEKQRGRKIQLGGRQQGNSQLGGQSATGSTGDLGSEMDSIGDGGQSRFGGGSGSDAENALIDGDSSRVGGAGGETGSHQTPGMESDRSAAERAKQS